MSLSTDPSFFKLLADNYMRLLKRPLVPASLSVEEGALWLYEQAPFGILSHNALPDPVFVYGNRTVQRLFEYEWNELTALPSRLSAEAPNREERQAFLERVGRDGFVEGYRGLRVSKSGKRFWIDGATVWQLTDDQGAYRGQAAMIPNWRDE
jgi:hypothetical protein